MTDGQNAIAVSLQTRHTRRLPRPSIDPTCPQRDVEVTEKYVEADLVDLPE
jgi:hypothetical protein